MLNAAARTPSPTRRLFLESGNGCGCAETSFVALKTAWGLDAPGDPSPAMAFNGGIAYSGGTCGAVTGAAIALGLLASRRIASHHEAKRVARELTAGLMDAFRSEQGSLACCDLIGVDLQGPGAHEAFIREGRWRDSCMGRIGFALDRLLPLADKARWREAVDALDRAAALRR